MKVFIIVAYVLLSFLPGYTQIDCYPRIGDRFSPIRKGVNLRSEPSLDSKVVLKSPDDEGVGNKGIKLICVHDGLTNDFVKVEVLFWNLTMADYGINSNLDYLLEKMKEHHDFNESFVSFYNHIQDTIKAKSIYEQVKNDEWTQDWSSADNYNMSTFEGFYKYWVQCTNNTDSINFILENHDRVLYVHKSVIEISGYVFTYSGPDAGVDYYINKIQEFQKMEEDNNCQYSSSAIYTHLKELVKLLIDEQKYFEAIKQINLYQHYLTTPKEKYKIAYLKMQASYFDNNFQGTLSLAENLIEGYKQKKIVNTMEEDYFGDLDMSVVYGMAISCLLKLERYKEGISLSNECLQTKNLQYSQYIEFHAGLLGSLGKIDEACKFLNEEYMKGNENAREMYLENCK